MSKFAIAKALAGFAVVSMVVLLVGCGGSSSSSDTSGGGADFASSADAICKDVNDQIKGIDQPTSAAGVKDYIDAVVPITSGAIDQLKALTPPSGKESDVDAWISTLQEQQDVAEQALSESADDPQKAVATLQKGDSLNTKGNSQAADLGLTTCAQDSSGGSSGGSSS